MVDATAAAQRELSKGTTELAILALIDTRPHYGYDLLSSMSEASNGGVEVKEGTLYPALHRLEDGGHIEATWEAEGRSAPRKYYRLTKAGKERLSMLRTEWDRLASGMDRLLNGGSR